MIAKERMLRRVAQSFEAYGFAPLQTPALEYQEVLLGKYGAEGDKLLYRFTDLGDRAVAMRYDLTVPLARVVAQYAELEQPFRRYQIGTVWRAEKPGPGRYREFMQCDVDITGTDAILADAEILAAGAAVLESLGVREFVIRVNNRKILNGALTRAGVTEEREVKDTLRVVDKLPKVGEAGVRSELSEAVGLASGTIDAVFEFLALNQGVDTEALVARLAPLMHGSEEGERGLDELRQLLGLVSAMGLTERVEVDLSIARGLDYYTGTIYETFLRGREAGGSVMSGGRYDTLIGMFKKVRVPAVGISLGIDRLFNMLLDLGLVQTTRATARVLVAVFDDQTAGEAASLAAMLRAAGVPTELYPAPDKLKKQFRYADRKGIPCVALVGPDELAQGQVKVKHLEERREDTVSRDELAAFLSE
jgi:histidyl-tRNA synthetase